MINFLHTYQPNPILISFGPVQIHWYGLFIVTGTLLAILITVKLARFYKIKTETIIDLAFWLIIFGLIGARLYHVLIELPYYLQHPLEIFYLWQGGLAIHGAIIAGLITIYVFAKKNSARGGFWQLAALITPGLALAQVIGRWGNYFNQELFGLPTNLPWGIPIDLINRPVEYLNYNYFQPTFLYESLSDILIFLLLILFYLYIIKTADKSRIINFQFSIFLPTEDLPKGDNFQLIVIFYLILYSLVRFLIEFIRIDSTPIIFNLRLPQLVSLIIIFFSLIYLIYLFLEKRGNKILHL